MVELITPTITERSVSLLRMIGHCGPLYFKQVMRALPAFVPELLERETRERLLYRELARLTKARLLERRRPPACRSAVYFVTTKGAGIIEARGFGATDLTNAERFFRKPRHEELLRAFTVELVLARIRPGSPLLSVSWSHVERFELLTEAGEKRGAYEPDSIVWIETNDGAELTVFIEIDRGTEPHKFWITKMMKAREVLRAHGSHVRLLVLCESERRLRSLARTSEGVLGPELLAETRWIAAGRFRAEEFFEAIFGVWKSGSMAAATLLRERPASTS